MFLTPDGAPFYRRHLLAADAAMGPAVVPSGAAGGRRGLARPARRAAGARRRARRPSHRDRRAAAGADLAPDDLTRVGEALLRLIDPVNGGIGDAPKFPNAPIFRFLWSEFFRRGDARCRDAVRGLLDALCAGGIYDHLGGGFARYSTDARMACAAFREDALRQRADSRIARARPRRDADAGLRRAGARDFRLADARNARRRTPSPPRWMPTRRARKGGSTSGARTRSMRPLGEDAAAFKAAYDVSPAAIGKAATCCGA